MPEGRRRRTKHLFEGLSDERLVDLDCRVLADVDPDVENVESTLLRPRVRVVAVVLGREVPACDGDSEVSEARHAGQKIEQTAHMMLRRLSESRNGKLVLCG